MVLECFSLFFIFFFIRPSTTLGQLKLHKASLVQFVHNPLMQTDNLYLQKVDFVSSRSICYIRHHFRVTSLTSHMHYKRAHMNAWSMVDTRSSYNRLFQCVSLPMPKAGKNELNKCKNQVECRDDTVPKTIDTRRHCKVGLRACNNLPQPLPTSWFLGVAEDCCMLSTLPCSAYSLWHSVIPIFCFNYYDDA